MKNYWLISLCATICFAAGCSKDDEGLVYPPDVAAEIPDAEFRLFCLGVADANFDGTISKEEALAVTKLNCIPTSAYVERFASLEGLKYFANLEELDCSRQRLTSLDVSGNTRLRKLVCPRNHLISLDLTRNFALETVNCVMNELTELRLPASEALIAVACEHNSLTSLEVSQCPALKSLSCESNRLTKLDVRSLDKLEYLTCPGVEVLDVMNCSELNALAVFGGGLSKLDLSHNPKLSGLMCDGVSLERLDLSHNSTLSQLGLSGMKTLKAIDVTGCTELDALYCYGTVCTTLDLSGCKKLKSIDIRQAPIGTLLLPESDVLRDLKLHEIEIERLDLSMYADSPQISLSLRKNSELRNVILPASLHVFDCVDCPHLEILDLTGCEKLTRCTCTGSSVSALDFSHCTEYSSFSPLVCSDNKLVSLQLPPKAYHVKCFGNLLEEIDISVCQGMGISRLQCQPMETLKRIRLRRDQKSATVPEGVELVFVD